MFIILPLSDQSPPKKRQCREEWYTADLVLQNDKGDTLLGKGDTLLGKGGTLLLAR